MCDIRQAAQGRRRVHGDITRVVHDVITGLEDTHIMFHLDMYTQDLRTHERQPGFRIYQTTQFHHGGSPRKAHVRDSDRVPDHMSLTHSRTLCHTYNHLHMAVGFHTYT